MALAFAAAPFFLIFQLQLALESPYSLHLAQSLKNPCHGVLQQPASLILLRLPHPPVPLEVPPVSAEEVGQASAWMASMPLVPVSSLAQILADAFLEWPTRHPAQVFSEKRLRSVPQTH